ncbi:tetrapyrrole biosynthesis, uroporphyrinogen III synthase [Cladochytrium replicatum]|nr:tetrapyrrole biosynthesis, uroporphyrinogen III synthase [Cladochytrium replicatum]
MNQPPLVLWLKDDPDDPASTAALNSVFPASHIFLPVLKKQPTPTPHLLSLLNSPASYRALIATSQVALASLAHALQNTSTQEPWLSKPIYVVGESTAAAARALQFTDIRGEDSGSANALAQLVLAESRRSDPPLLFLVGDKTRDVITRTLKDGCVQVETVQVYRTCPDERFEESMVDALGDRPPSWVVFFSPSGVDVAAEALARREWWVGGRVRVGSVGPTTTEGLRRHGIAVGAEAVKPGVLGVLKQIAESAKKGKISGSDGVEAVGE